MTGGMALDNITVDTSDFHSSANQSSCDVFIYQSAAVVLFPVFYSLIFLISLCGNSLVLYVICQRKQKFNSTSIYLVNLALSDTLFTLALPGRITYYIRWFDWPFGDLLCRLTALLFFANTYAGNVTKSAVGRYHASRCLSLFVYIYIHICKHIYIYIFDTS